MVVVEQIYPAVVLGQVWSVVGIHSSIQVLRQVFVALTLVAVVVEGVVWVAVVQVRSCISTQAGHFVMVGGINTTQYYTFIQIYYSCGVLPDRM